MNFPDEAILLEVGKEENKTPHDWQMFSDDAINQNRNGAALLHAILKLAKRSLSSCCQVEVLLHKQYRRIFCVSRALQSKESPST